MCQQSNGVSLSRWGVTAKLGWIIIYVKEERTVTVTGEQLHAEQYHTQR